MIKYATVQDVENLDLEGKWLSGGGECCGFDSWVEGNLVHTKARGCGYNTQWKKKPLPLEQVRAAILEALRSAKFQDEYALEDVIVPIDNDVHVVIRKDDPRGDFSLDADY